MPRGCWRSRPRVSRPTSSRCTVERGMPRSAATSGAARRVRSRRKSRRIAMPRSRPGTSVAGSRRRADIDVSVADADIYRRKAVARVARVAAGRHVELEAVPRADDLRRRAEAQAEALALGIEHFLDLAVD